jgi:hypothetical protein
LRHPEYLETDGQMESSEITLMRNRRLVSSARRIAPTSLRGAMMRNSISSSLLQNFSNERSRNSRNLSRSETRLPALIFSGNTAVMKSVFRFVNWVAVL